MLIHTNMHAYPNHTWMQKKNKNINYRAFLVEICLKKGYKLLQSVMI